MLAKEARLMHWRRIISATRELWKERGSICKDCHSGGFTACFFCFCPLYDKEDCGGRYRILKGGVKDCSGCDKPHHEEFIIEQLERLYE